MCQDLGEIDSYNGNPRKIYETLKKITEKNKLLVKSKPDNVLPILGNNQGKVNMKWNKFNCGLNIELTMDNTAASLKEEAYVFRTVVVKEPFLSGRHYWEIHADPKT